MASKETRRWESDWSGQTRRERRPCDYDVYLPDSLLGRDFSPDHDTYAQVVDAEKAISRLNSEADVLADTEALARLLLRAESVASSRIEGLEIGSRRLLRADAAKAMGEDPRDVTATEILGNIDAMTLGISAIEAGDPITPGLLLEMHGRLLASTRMKEHAGKFRDVQNWIGKSPHNPCTADFVPPPPELIEQLIDDLCAFCNDDQLPAIPQAAIAHAQFETIHPFADGNGRTGRALIHLILRRRGVVTRVLPPISLILATWSQDYIAALSATHYEGDPDSPAASDALNAWISLFALACERAVDDATRFETQVRALRESWRERAGLPRRDSATQHLIDLLPMAPVLTANTAVDLIGRSLPATTAAITRLQEAGVLVQINVGKRNRAFEAPELIDAFTALERRLGSPEGDTRVSAPSRRVPRLLN